LTRSPGAYGRRSVEQMSPLALDALGIGTFGEDVTVYDWVRLLNPERISFGSHIIVDDFVLLQGGTGLRICDYVHIASFVSLTGGGRCQIGNFTGIASGARLLTGTDLADGTGLLGPQIPAVFRSVDRPGLTIEDFVLIGANSVVHPGVSIGEGAVVGAGSVVLHDLEPWSVNVGVPARQIKRRPRKKMLEHARRLGYGPSAEL
jgi:acetyltransferase-like isoleucine patch superfamily enzyme